MESSLWKSKIQNSIQYSVLREFGQLNDFWYSCLVIESIALLLPKAVSVVKTLVEKPAATDLVSIVLEPFINSERNFCQVHSVKAYVVVSN